jgi:hypothetical protein
VTGKVHTPWFGESVGINLAWRFLLNPQGKIFLVAIDVLASPKELTELGIGSVERLRVECFKQHI